MADQPEPGSPSGGLPGESTAKDGHEHRPLQLASAAEAAMTSEAQDPLMGDQAEQQLGAGVEYSAQPLTMTPQWGHVPAWPSAAAVQEGEVFHRTVSSPCAAVRSAPG